MHVIECNIIDSNITYIYIYIHTHIGMFILAVICVFASRLATAANLREMGGVPRNPASRNHFLVRIFKPSGCHCTDASGGRKNMS